MKSGMVRRIDELGRIVIPKEIRKNLKLNTGDVVEIFVDDNKIFLKRFSTLLGLEEDLFNIAKVINELTSASILFIDQDHVIVSYGKLSEKYIDGQINSSLYHKVNDYGFIKLNNVSLSNDFLEQRITYATSLYHKNSLQGLMILIENEKVITQSHFDIINQFKKFISKQLDS